MPDTPLYLEAKPGDLITADNWNELQRRVQKDIVDTTQKAVAGVTDVNHAKDSDTLQGKTAEQLATDIIGRAVEKVHLQSGYQQIFTVLHYHPDKPEDRVIAHNLGLPPLTDVYRLNYFPVVYRRNQQTFTGWATFYLYHEVSESSIRFTAPDNRTTSVEIEPNGPAHRIRWKSLLDRYGVKYDDPDLPLDDLLTDFWDAFLAAPNVGFEPSQYGHSPWFEKCCDDERKVKDMSKEFDHLYLKMVPEKIAYFPAPSAVFATPAETKGGAAAIDLRTQVRVTHYDFDTLGLRLLTPADYAQIPAPPALVAPLVETFQDLANELKVMVLLKV
jgi:hypothetical protein